MQPEMTLLWEVSLFEFLLVTIVIGGGIAFMIGRSTALTWSGWAIMAFYVALLTIAARFIHFSLFDGTFFLPFDTIATALHYALIDYVVLFLLASFGRLRTRSQQMARQYRFLRTAATN
jgi:hypothetical protein